MLVTEQKDNHKDNNKDKRSECKPMVHMLVREQKRIINHILVIPPPPRGKIDALLGRWSLGPERGKQGENSYLQRSTISIGLVRETAVGCGELLQKWQ